ncbi:hypothetical protein CSB96_1507 [Pseudomonas aeruginosa]|nr:hypothetical protein CSB96_1507 [Pseudomonas aeruginosa]
MITSSCTQPSMLDAHCRASWIGTPGLTVNRAGPAEGPKG